MSGKYDSWVGREVRAFDTAAAAPVARLAATLDHDGAHWKAGVLPPLGHWLFHLPEARHSVLGPDGHPERGDFLPPIPQVRRMWAGSRIRFLAAIPIGAAIEKRSTIAAVAEKQGAAGDMVFVTLRHEILIEGGKTAIVDEQDLVFLDIAPPAQPRPIERPAPFSERTLVADAAMLFRFSALTFNAHRIHYDLHYARAVEHYPDLVVHGPLQAMLLLDDAIRVAPSVPVESFSFRARAPLYPGRPFTLCRNGTDLWICDDDGATTMTAELKSA